MFHYQIPKGAADGLLADATSFNLHREALNLLLCGPAGLPTPIPDPAEGSNRKAASQPQPHWKLL